MKVGGEMRDMRWKNRLRGVRGREYCQGEEGERKRRDQGRTLIKRNVIKGEMVRKKRGRGEIERQRERERR